MWTLLRRLRFGADNVIAVRVDSREQKGCSAGRRAEVFRILRFGGIQRDVQLIVKDRLHIERVYYVTAAFSRMRPLRNDYGSQ